MHLLSWLDSLIFNDEVQAYQSWTLFLIFVSILVLILGVVLLTHKKPEPVKPSNIVQNNRRRRKPKRNGVNGVDADVEEGHQDSEGEALWALGDDSDEDIDEDEDEDVDHHQNPLNHRDELNARRTVIPRSTRGPEINEHTGLVEVEPSLADDRDRRRGIEMDGFEVGVSGSAVGATRSRPHR